MAFLFLSQHIQLVSAIAFFALLGIFLFYRRAMLDIQVILGIPRGKNKGQVALLYTLLYRTKLGLALMEGVARRLPKTLKALSYLGVIIGFAGMAIIAVSLAWNVYRILFFQQKVGAAIVQPFVQTGEGSMFFYVPFFYFIISIFIIAVIHEMSHGVISRLFKVPLKSSGFAFLGLIIPIVPMAFVEPDEKRVRKIKPMQQLAIFAAGPFSNILLAIMLMLLTAFAVSPALEKVISTDVIVTNFTIAGNNSAVVPAEASGMRIGEAIVRIDNHTISGASDFAAFMSRTKPGQEVRLVTNASAYAIKLVASPSKSTTGYLGVYVKEVHSYKPNFQKSFGFIVPVIEWTDGLLVWLIILNIGIGLINLLPLGPIDGGRMVLVLLRARYKEKRAMQLWAKISAIALVLLLANVFLPTILSLFR